MSVSSPVKNLIFVMFPLSLPPSPMNVLLVEISENVAGFLKIITGTLGIVYVTTRRLESTVSV